MTADESAVLAFLRTKARGVSARTIAQALKWRKPGDEIPGWKKSNSRRMIIWDEHRVHLAARKLEKAGEVEVKVSARFTRYKAVR